VCCLDYADECANKVLILMSDAVTSSSCELHWSYTNVLLQLQLENRDLVLNNVIATIIKKIY